MSEILQIVITNCITFLTTGGIGSIFYFRLHKRMKEAELHASEISNLSSSNDEWIRLYETERDEKSKLMEQNHILNERINKLHEDKGLLISKCEKKERIISELNWYRCEMNRCPYRKPPRKYGDFDLPEDAIIPKEENEN